MEISVQMDNSEKEFIKNAIASVLRKKRKRPAYGGVMEIYKIFKERDS